MKKILAAAAALLALASVPARADDTVSVQVVRSLSQAPYFIALGKGYFTQEGIKLEAGEVRSALDTIGPLATGRLDASMGAATAGFFNAADRGFDLRIVAALGIQGKPLMATQPLVRRALWDNGTIRSGKDLKGHKVAINAPGDITEYFLTLIADKYKFPLKAIDVTPLAFREQMVAFKNGAIDAGFLPEPLGTTSRLAGDTHLLEPDDDIGYGTATTFLFYGLKFIQERPQVALRFMRALIRGARDAREGYNKDPALAAMIAKETSLKPEAVEQAAAYAIDPNLDIVKYEPSLRQLETIHRRNGRLTYQKPLDFASVIDPKIAREAAASLK